MRRREFIAGLGVAATWPIAAHAQQSSNVYRVAWVNPAVPVADMSESSGIRGFREFFKERKAEGRGSPAN